MAAAEVVVIRPGTGPTRAPLFCVHAEAGDLRLYVPLAERLPAAQSVLGLRAPAPERLSYARLEELAAHHVASIRAARPEGPYLIAGECSGGALAFEIASQLRRAGAEVGLLILIDAFAPGHPRLAPVLPRALYRLLDRARVLGFHARNVTALGPRERREYIASRAKRHALALLRRARRGSAASTRSPERAFRDALARYQPRAYDGAAVLIRACSLPLGVRSGPGLGWQGLVASLAVETVPGYFTTPISEPGVELLAQRLARLLEGERAQSGV